jgi:hypothetical protein
VPSAESGSGKTETIRHAFKRFREFEQRAVTEWRAETQPGLKAEIDMLQAELAKLKKEAAKCKSEEQRQEILQKFATHHAELQELEGESDPPLLSVEDLTTEALVVLLSKRSETLASISSDAGSVINNLLGRYSKQDRTDETIYLKTWSGEPCRVHRIGRESVLPKASVLVCALARSARQDRYFSCDRSIHTRRLTSSPLGLPHGMSAKADSRRIKRYTNSS